MKACGDFILIIIFIDYSGIKIAPVLVGKYQLAIVAALETSCPEHIYCFIILMSTNHTDKMRNRTIRLSYSHARLCVTYHHIVFFYESHCSWQATHIGLSKPAKFFHQYKKVPSLLFVFQNLLL